jgi:hypothetical protein
VPIRDPVCPHIPVCAERAKSLFPQEKHSTATGYRRETPLLPIEELFWGCGREIRAFRVSLAFEINSFKLLALSGDFDRQEHQQTTSQIEVRWERG